MTNVRHLYLRLSLQHLHQFIFNITDVTEQSQKSREMQRFMGENNWGWSWKILPMRVMKNIHLRWQPLWKKVAPTTRPDQIIWVQTTPMQAKKLWTREHQPNQHESRQNSRSPDQVKQVQTTQNHTISDNRSPDKKTNTALDWVTPVQTAWIQEDKRSTNRVVQTNSGWGP